MKSLKKRFDNSSKYLNCIEQAGSNIKKLNSFLQGKYFETYIVSERKLRFFQVQSFRKYFSFNINLIFI